MQKVEKLEVNFEFANLNSEIILKNTPQVNNIVSGIKNEKLPGHDFYGWMNGTLLKDSELLSKINQTAKKLKMLSSITVVVGIGGSYSGAKAIIDMVKGVGNLSPDHQIIWMGHNMSSYYYEQITSYLLNKKFNIIAISKSGTTLEPSMTFRILRRLLIKNVKMAHTTERIVVITDKNTGVFKEIADNQEYEQFVIPDDVGGRYSAFTPVALLPAAIAGVNIEQLVKGALETNEVMSNNPSLKTNSAYLFALARANLYHSKKYSVEFNIVYENNLQGMQEWYKQLWSESEGKDGKGLVTTSSVFSTDLHSIGQFLQEGTPCFFETIVTVTKPQGDLAFVPWCRNEDKLDFLNGKTIDEINKMAFAGVLKAHTSVRKTPAIIIKLANLEETTIGYFFQWMFHACTMYCYLIGVNPFNQPGVEVYKKNMFALLGK